MGTSFIAVLTATIAATAAGAARAGEPIRPDCLAYVQAAEGRSYDNEEHRLWYRRFWTGRCEGFSLFRCSSGEPFWNGVVSTLIERNPQLEHSAVLSRACRLGELVGYEWAKDNAIRCIHTSDVRVWGEELYASEDGMETVERIRGMAQARLGC